MLSVSLSGLGYLCNKALLDGTWSEARKIFRKSPYLNGLPVLSLQPEQLSRYRLRRHIRDNHFCTAEVAAMCLDLAGESLAAQTLEAYLDVFSERYLLARQSVAANPDDAAHQRLRMLSLAAAESIKIGAHSPILSSLMPHPY